MPHSMTAFARRDRDTPWGVLTWELRSVNHRYLELSLRLPEELRALETQVREQLTRGLGRGKVDATLRFQPHAIAAEPRVDEGLLGRLLVLGRKAESLAAHAGASIGPWRVSDLLRWPGVLAVDELDVTALGSAALALLRETLGELQDTRQREGGRLREVLEARLTALGQIAATMRASLPELARTQRDRLRQRLEELGVSPDPGRFEQELALLLQKADVGEELDRLDVHLQEARDVLGQDGAIGRRLDFLMQELNREANTLGSKAADARQSSTAVELKVLIEQLREQVQNIE